MRYIQSQMKKLVKDNKELQMRLRELMDEHELEKGFALKALYHSEVAEGGKYQLAYQALDLPKGIILIFQSFMMMNHGRRGDRVVRVSNPK